MIGDSFKRSFYDLETKTTEKYSFTTSIHELINFCFISENKYSLVKFDINFGVNAKDFS